jgi:hypothetical protein
VRISRSFEALRAAISPFEACLTDTVRTFHGSVFLGTTLLILYATIIFSGLLFATWLYDLLDPILSLFSLVLPLTADLAVEVGLLVLFLYLSSYLACIAGRAIVRGLVYLGFEMRENALFYSLLLALICSLVALVILLFMPPIVSEEKLIEANGLATSAVFILGALTVWFFVRYRWAANRRRHIFDHEIGLAWSHMTDTRRARYDFNRNH